MRLTYGELIEELQGLPAEELYDIAEVAKKFAIERRREEMLKNAEESMKEYTAGYLPAPTSDIDALWQQIKAGQ